MSKVNRGFNLTAQNGSIGAVTYVTRKGITVARQKVPAKSTARRTIANMTTRVRWMNLVRLWQQLNTVDWRPSFMDKTGLQSDFNMFMRANTGLNVYLTSQEVAAKGAVVAPAIITSGGLPPVGGDFDAGGQFVSDLNLGGITIGSSTTVKTLSDAIVNNNPGWEYGDQITMVVMQQSQDIDSGTPRVTTTIHQMYLDGEDETTMVGDLFDVSFITAVDGKLALAGPIMGGAAVVHSRGEGSTYDVSSERLASNNTMLSLYQTAEALTLAIDSYGGLSGRFYLVPSPDDNTVAGQ